MRELLEIFDYFEHIGYRIYPSNREKDIKRVYGWRAPLKIAHDKIFYYSEVFESCKFSPFLTKFLVYTKQPGKPAEMDFCDHCLEKFQG